MKHLILGTAGHVDHGKTSLIRALTGFDCDTHKEERSRGITIHLGFTNIALDKDHQIGIIDVPGHKDFVNTMIAGASGIDFVMLIISADSGIMPQTEEHLKIMKLLKIKSGFVALTKIDLVDQELIELAKSEIEDFTKNTFLESCPIISVSSKTGQGIDEIKSEIINQINKTDERDLGVIFRMYIDRIFTSDGYGTIINGSVLSGKVSKEQQLKILPANNSLRIRGLQKFHQDVKEVKAGDRASLNVVGLKRSEFKRGMIITNVSRQQSVMLDCTLENFSNKKLELWTTVIFLSGTFRSKAKIHLIDKDVLEENQACIVQITLEETGIFYYNDKYILRDSSNQYTIGGGVIIDAFPLKHRKRPEKLIQKLKRLTDASPKYVILNEIEKSVDIINSSQLSYMLNMPEKKVREIALTLTDQVAIIKQGDVELYIIDSHLKKIHEEILKIIRRYHLNNSLSKKGLYISDIAKYLTTARETLTKKSLTIILENLKEKQEIVEIDNTFALSSHQVNDQKLASILDNIYKTIDDLGYDIPEQNTKEYFKDLFKLKSIEINSIINLLIEEGKILIYDNQFLSLEKLRQIYSLMKENFANQDFRISEFRDLLATNRKIALYYLEIFDKLGITRRNEDFRSITNKEMI